MRCAWVSLAALLLVTGCDSAGSAVPSDADNGDAADATGPVDASVEQMRPPLSDGARDEPPPVTGPDRLSQTGLYADFGARTLAPGIVSYVPRWELWSDGAQKKRYLLLPPTTQIDTTFPDDWTFPVGTKVWKEFHAGGKLVETRLQWKEPTGWWMMAYEWLPDGSDAVAMPNGDVNALGTTHDVPSQEQCHKCHDNVVDALVGIGAMQLGASDGDGTLANLAAAGVLSQALPKTTFDVPGSGVVKDALGYMHGNCGHCHNEIGGLRFQMQLRLQVLVADTDPLQTAAYTTAIDKPDVHQFDTDAGLVALSIVPGDPELSELWWRMAQRGLLAMPPVCTKVVDPVGSKTLHDWIQQMVQSGDAGGGG